MLVIVWPGVRIHCATYRTRTRRSFVVWYGGTVFKTCIGHIRPNLRHLDMVELYPSNDYTSRDHCGLKSLQTQNFVPAAPNLHQALLQMGFTYRNQLPLMQWDAPATQATRYMPANTQKNDDDSMVADDLFSWVKQKWLCSEIQRQCGQNISRWRASTVFLIHAHNIYSKLSAAGRKFLLWTRWHLRCWYMLVQ